MSKKRKSDATRLDEMDRSMYNTFCSAANSLSQLYSQAMNHQRVSFQDGERHALEKLFQWILRQQEEGTRVTTADIVAHLQNELEYGAEESPMSPRPSFHQSPQPATHMNASSASLLSTPISASTIGQGARSGDYRGKNLEFSNAIPNPVQGSLQHYQSVHQVGYHSNNVVSSSADRPQNDEINYSHQQNGEADSSIFSDYMDMPMHGDSPVYE
ncbi:TSL-kinase interacting protein 1-like isoform X1 [Hibiscus syriacus]|uniref:TSL-kinase interacting protein 1-like isoform X1 n=1 Tax=Hibiscus syriacus TaxID=106335 RepID=A0A6A2Y605_HIBSY|nr:uncharacterized protein LOC120181239 [Hibiscus syriacus]KAE8665987.1 TSL-kinase interacting protein 1-like isoform X1 [Hibiscus syriacus]